MITYDLRHQQKHIGFIALTAAGEVEYSNDAAKNSARNYAKRLGVTKVDKDVLDSMYFDFNKGSWSMDIVPPFLAREDQ